MRVRGVSLIVLAIFATGCRAPQSAPDSSKLISQARKLDLEGDQAAAIALYQQAIEGQPDSFDAHYGIARALDLAGYRTGHEMAGRGADRLAWQIDLADMRWAHAQARIAARRGHATEARRQEAVVKKLLDKGGKDDQRPQYAYLLGYVEFYLNDYAASIAALKQADDQDPFILLLLGQAHERLGESDQARECYRRVLQSNSHAVNSAFARPIARRKLAARD